jgi:TPR repeat protein
MKFTLLAFLFSAQFAMANQLSIESCKGVQEGIDEVRKEGSAEHQVLSYLITLQAQCYLNGIFVEKNIAKAKSLLAESIEIGNKQASHILASINLFKSDDATDWKMGLESFKEEYKNGSFYSAGKIGWAHNLGRGTKKDPKEAFKYYQVAASGGMTLWQFLLAHSYERGYYGVEPNKEKAEYWRNFQPKVHVYDYDCAIHSLYEGGNSFPKNEELELEFKNRCESSVNKAKQ